METWGDGMKRNTKTADRPVLQLVSARSQAADNLQELRRAVGAAGVLMLVLSDELDKAKAALSALERGQS